MLLQIWVIQKLVQPPQQTIKLALCVLRLLNLLWSTQKTMDALAATVPG